MPTASVLPAEQLAERPFVAQLFGLGAGGWEGEVRRGRWGGE